MENNVNTLMVKGIKAEITTEAKERLFEVATDVLHQYGYNTSDYALGKIVDTWSDKKGWIINLLSKHKYYNGNFQIVIPADLKRPIDADGIKTFKHWFLDTYMESLKKHKIMIGLHDYIEYKRAVARMEDILCRMFSGCVYKGYTLAEMENEYRRMGRRLEETRDKYRPRTLLDSKGNEFAVPRDVYHGYEALRNVISKTFNNVCEDGNMLNETKVDDINSYLADGEFTTRAVVGQKISKFIGKLCKEVGLNHVVDIQTQSWTDASGEYHERQKDMGYNYHFALLGDSINPLTYTRDVVISVNPIDFWTMSFGYKWASCHTIDKENRRQVPNHNYEGCYSGGTESYMLDDSTIIVYVRPGQRELESNGEHLLPLELQSKFKRCVFHLGEDKLIQGRLYPDGRDGGDEGLASQLRNIVQKEIADLLETPNMWTLKKGTYECESVIDTFYGAPHYPDYEHYSDCNVSYLRRIDGVLNTKSIVVGSDIICPDCGAIHNTEAWITCEHCRRMPIAYCDGCGDAIYEDEDYILTYDGNYYCNEVCAMDHDYVCCEDDGMWHRTGDTVYDDYTDCYYADDSEAVYTGDGYSYRNWENAEADGWVYCEYDEDWARTDDIREIGNSGNYFIIDQHPHYITTVDDHYYPDGESAAEDGYSVNDNDEWIISTVA